MSVAVVILVELLLSTGFARRGKNVALRRRSDTMFVKKLLAGNIVGAYSWLQLIVLLVNTKL